MLTIIFVALRGCSALLSLSFGLFVFLFEQIFALVQQLLGAIRHRIAATLTDAGLVVALQSAHLFIILADVKDLLRALVFHVDYGDFPMGWGGVHRQRHACKQLFGLLFVIAVESFGIAILFIVLDDHFVIAIPVEVELHVFSVHDVVGVIILVLFILIGVIPNAFLRYGCERHTQQEEGSEEILFHTLQICF